MRGAHAVQRVDDKLRSVDRRLAGAFALLDDIRDDLRFADEQKQLWRQQMQAEIHGEYQAELDRLRALVAELKGYDPETMEKRS